MNSFISYEGLPINSGGAHSISSNQLLIIYEQVLLFLNTYTNCDSPDSTYLISNNFQINKVMRYSYSFSGIPKFNINNYIGSRQKIVSWNISRSQINKAIQFINETDELTLAVTWKFRFVDLATRQILSGQNEIPVIDERFHNSQIHLRLAKTKSTISIWFTFPFEKLEGLNSMYIEGMKEKLPFKFSNKNWRLWTLSKNGKWISKTLDMDLYKEN